MEGIPEATEVLPSLQKADMKRLDATAQNSCKIGLETETPGAAGLLREETGFVKIRELVKDLGIISSAAQMLVSNLRVACACGAARAEPLFHAEDCHVYLKDLILNKSARELLISSQTAGERK